MMDCLVGFVPPVCPGKCGVPNLASNPPLRRKLELPTPLPELAIEKYVPLHLRAYKRGNSSRPDDVLSSQRPPRQIWNGSARGRQRRYISFVTPRARCFAYSPLCSRWELFVPPRLPMDTC